MLYLHREKYSKKFIKKKIFLRKDAKNYICIRFQVTQQETDHVDLLSSEGRLSLDQKHISLEYNFNTKSLILSACKFLTLTFFIYLKTVYQILHQPLWNITNRLPLIPLGNFCRNTIPYDPPTRSPQLYFSFPLLLNNLLT